MQGITGQSAGTVGGEVRKSVAYNSGDVPGGGKETAIAIEDVTHRFRKPRSRSAGGGAMVAITDVTLRIGRGEFVSVVGPSGCGKSTLLGLISGLTPVQHGSVSVNGERVTKVRDDVGFVMQKDVLLPWKTVTENIALPLMFRGVARRERAELAKEWTERVGLTGFGNHYPSQLSGGMRKRAQLATTMVYEPSILLMDEPFSALDAQTRNLMENDLLNIWSMADRDTTVMFVTHDLDEAISLADRVVVMSASPGRVRAVYDVTLPRPRDVAELRGEPAFAELRSHLWEDLRAEVQLAYARND